MARPRPEKERVTMVTWELRRVETRGVVMIEERGTVERGTEIKGRRFIGVETLCWDTRALRSVSMLD